MSVNAVKLEISSENLEACRICLAWNEKLYNIHECGLDTMFVELMGTTLSSWDGFPQHICVVCRALLVKANVLRARCRRAEALLKEALMHQHFITNSFIWSIDRSAHNLTYTLSSEGGKVDLRSYQYVDNTLESPNFVALEHITDDADDSKLNLDIDFHSTESNTSDTGQVTDVKDMGIKVSKQTVKDLSLDIDLHLTDSNKPDTEQAIDFKDNALKKKTLKWKKVKDGRNKRNNPADLNGPDTEQAIDFKDNAVKQKSVKWKKVKDVRNKGRKGKFSTDEDFKEFEKEYDFQVQVLTDAEMMMEMERRKESNKYQKGIYKCELCYNGFLTASIYSNHMRTHEPARGDQECSLCHIRFNYPVKLRQHVQNAHRLKFRCARCSEVVRGKACAILHAAYHSGATFQCPHCDKQFLKKTSRTSHMRASHPAENAAGGTCELCGETFTSRTGLRSHKTRSHKKTSSPALRCRKCGVQFDNMEAIKRHRELQSNKKCDGSLSACESCGETCASADQLILHRHQRHNVELFTCDTCTKSFTSKASLATHIDRVHRNVRPPKMDYSDGGKRKQDWLHWASVCEHCGKRLSCRATLKIHMNKHTGERPYKCTLCPKAYMTPYGLNNHQAYHTGVRKWQCPECPATFMHQSSVYVHRKIHTGERSHRCTICDKYFTQSGSLYTHVKYVHMKETPPPRKRNRKTAA